jgi:hypothetical protein
MAVDARHRDKAVEISRKHGNTLIGTLRISYGIEFGKGCANGERLSDVLANLDEPSLFKLVRDHEAGMLPIRLRTFWRVSVRRPWGEDEKLWYKSFVADFGLIETAPTSPSKPRRRGTMERPRPLPLRVSTFLFAPVIGQAFALGLFAGKLAGSAYGLSLFANFSLGRLFIWSPLFHLAKGALSLHLSF